MKLYFKKNTFLIIVCMAMLQCMVAQSQLSWPDSTAHPKAVMPKQVAVPANTRLDVFNDTVIAGMKSFFIQNAAKPVQPDSSLWHSRYKLACINTVRTGLECLLFGNSAIPDSLYSKRQMFNCFGQKNTVDALMKKLEDSGYVSNKATIGFTGLNRGMELFIDSNRSYLEPVKMSGSLWQTIQSMAGPVKGWSVFVISLCSGIHTAILSVNHIGPDNMLVFWSDQTMHHIVAPEDRMPPYAQNVQYGWEWLNKAGTMETNPRGLDAYVLYAIKTYWCNCKFTEVKDPPKRGICFPEVRLWQISGKY